MTGTPTQLPAIDVQVYDVQVLEDNRLALRLKFNDGTRLLLEFPPDSPLSHDLLELLAGAANDMLQRLGQRGIAVTGWTAPEEEEPQT